MVGKNIKGILNFVAWLTGILVSLAVGFAMIDGVIAVRWIPEVVTMVAGWIVVVSTALSAVLAILKQ
tara:strand:- start:660 stop:860 length:201 start_codon:yes stop_codon:yes gene_type:complete